MNALDDIVNQGKPYYRVCECGEPSTARLMLNVRRLDEHRRSGQSASVSRNYCDGCAAKLYLELAPKVRPS